MVYLVTASLLSVASFTEEVAAQEAAGFPLVIRWVLPGGATEGESFIVDLGSDESLADAVSFGLAVGDADQMEDVYRVTLTVPEGRHCYRVQRLGAGGGDESATSLVSCKTVPAPDWACDQADINKDGVVGGPDFAQLRAQWNKVCQG